MKENRNIMYYHLYIKYGKLGVSNNSHKIHLKQKSDTGY